MDEPQYHLTRVVHTKESLLEDFEGPLDVILLLLSKNKIQIADISISSILSQYLAYLEEMKRMDMEIASEFITMASHLMHIKTKMLLSYSERSEAESEMETLMESLRARQAAAAKEQLRDAIGFLETQNSLGLGLFTKDAEPLTPEAAYRYQHEAADLLRAMERISERTQRRMPPPATAFTGIVGREPYPVSKKAREVLRCLAQEGCCLLLRLFRGCISRSEIVATFLAILELCRTRCAKLITEPEMAVEFVSMPREDTTFDAH